MVDEGGGRLDLAGLQAPTILPTTTAADQAQPGKSGGVICFYLTLLCAAKGASKVRPRKNSSNRSIHSTFAIATTAKVLKPNISFAGVVWVLVGRKKGGWKRRLVGGCWDKGKVKYQIVLRKNSIGSNFLLFFWLCSNERRVGEKRDISRV